MCTCCLCHESKTHDFVTQKTTDIEPCHFPLIQASPSNAFITSLLCLTYLRRSFIGVFLLRSRASVCLICTLCTILYYLDITEISINKAGAVPAEKSMKRLCLDENRAVQLILPFPRASSSQLCSSPSREKMTPAPAVSRFTAQQTEFQAAGAWRPLRSLPLAAQPRPLGDGAGGTAALREGPARPAAPAAPTPPSSRHPAARASRPRRQHNPPCRRRAGLACLATDPRPPPGLAPASAPR